MSGALTRLKTMAGAATALELLDRFLTQAPVLLENCLQARERGDWASLVHHLHRLRSDAGWLGATAVQDMAGLLERQAESGQLQGWTESLDHLAHLCYQASQDLHRQRILLQEEIS